MKRLGPTQVGLISAVMALVPFGAIAFAQQDGPPPPGARMMMRGAGPGGDEIGFVGFEAGITGKTVTGAPFSATITTQITRTLADGNKIERTTMGTFARDSQGRTRREMSFSAIALGEPAANAPKHAVFINDPVGATSYVLHPDSKTAEQVPSHNWKGKNGPGANMRGFGERFQNEETTTDLGTQNINGVTAQGTRVTRTIAAGEIGNEKAIVMVTERWYSPELQTYVMTKRTDPLMGDTTFQLTNIQRNEPDPALFQVPSGYSVSQRPGPAARFGRGGGPGGQPQPPQN